MNVPHRPYSKLKNQPVSVTTALPTPHGLDFAAAKETAIFASLHRDRWLDLPEAEGIDLLRKHFRGIWDGRAAVGTAVHAVNEMYCAGHEVDLYELVGNLLETDKNTRTWRDMHRTDIVEIILGYVLGLERWWDDFQPRVIASEAVVRWPEKYIGQTDLRAWVNGSDCLFDLKTTHNQDENRAIYHDDWTKQLNGYAWAPERVFYGFEGDELVETHTEPWTRPDKAGVIHLRGQESYDLYPIAITEEARDRFLAHVEDHYWRKNLKKPIPIRPKEAVA